MCVFSGVLGSGKILTFQLVTFFSILIAMGAWVYLFIRGRLGPQLRSFLIPICLWFVFGTLDILITVKGTYANPLQEADPATRLILLQFGPLGAAVASVLWISLWAGIVYAMNKARPGRISEFVSLCAFYCLAAGHFFGFSSWFLPLCQFSEPGLLWVVPVALAALHWSVAGMKKG